MPRLTLEPVSARPFIATKHAVFACELAAIHEIAYRLVSGGTPCAFDPRDNVLSLAEDVVLYYLSAEIGSALRRGAPLSVELLGPGRSDGWDKAQADPGLAALCERASFTAGRRRELFVDFLSVGLGTPVSYTDDVLDALGQLAFEYALELFVAAWATSLRYYEVLGESRERGKAVSDDSAAPGDRTAQDKDTVENKATTSDDPAQSEPPTKEAKAAKTTKLEVQNDAPAKEQKEQNRDAMFGIRDMYQHTRVKTPDSESLVDVTKPVPESLFTYGVKRRHPEAVKEADSPETDDQTLLKTLRVPDFLRGYYYVQKREDKNQFKLVKQNIGHSATKYDILWY